MALNSSSKEFGMVPVSNIRGWVHIVTADFAIPLLDTEVERKRHV